MTIRFQEPIKVRDPAEDDEIILRATQAAAAMLAGIDDDNEEEDCGTKRKANRINWGVGQAKKQLERAVEEWDLATGRAVDPVTGQKLSLPEYATRVEIPYHTFRKYVGSKRRTIGNSTGRQPLLDRQEQEWIAQKLADRGEGWLAQEAVDLVLERHPELTKEQATRHIQRTLLKHNANNSEDEQKLKVPPKRAYHKQGKEEDLSEEEEETAETEEEEDEDEEPLVMEDNAQKKKDEKAKELAAIDAKIARLRSELLDAELEKERLLRR